MAGHADVCDLGDTVFTPNIRTSVAMIRVPCKTAMFKFLSAWRQADEAGLISRFGDDGLVIRAKRDKPLAIRKAHGKLWQLSVHFKCLGHGDVDIDWRNCDLWINDCLVVKWDIHKDSATWMEQDLLKHNLQIDVEAANLAVSRARSS